LQGSGPLGLPGPGGVQQFVAQLQASAARIWPQIRGVIDTPGAIELRSELGGALSRRFVARTIKLIFGPQVGALARYDIKSRFERDFSVFLLVYCSLLEVKRSPESPWEAKMSS